MKACLISAPMTGSGKTTLTLGLLWALRERGFRVQPFKVGPDFIDPGLHALAAGTPSHNLDGWMVAREANEWLFSMACAGKDMAIVEGVMGLFDGFDGTHEAGSSAEMAQWLGLKVILVIDASGLARSAAAIVRGICDFDKRIDIAGIVFNRVGGAGHFQILADAVTDVPILGWLPSNPLIEMPERHLGLMTAAEELPATRIRSIGSFVERHLDISRIIDLLPDVDTPARDRTFQDRPVPTIRVALAHDKAFSFYYQANRLEIERAGGRIIEFSPLHDAAVPDADFLYIGGGYPELYRKELAANTSMRDSIRAHVSSGKRFYAECGGLMYLSRDIEGSSMVGIVPAKVEMTPALVDFGYCDVTAAHDSILGAAGITARGHQFHYSRAVGETANPVYRVHQGHRRYEEGYLFPNGVASYIHLHFLSNRNLARNMLQSSSNEREV